MSVTVSVLSESLYLEESVVCICYHPIDRSIKYNDKDTDYDASSDFGSGGGSGVM